MAAKRHVDTDNSTINSRGDYSRTLKSIRDRGFCPFCEQNLMKSHRRPLIYKSKYWLVTENTWPYEGSRHHFLFIARPHVESTEKMSAIMWTDLHAQYRKIIKKYGIKGASFMLRSGDTKYTGASVSHLHAHVVVGSPRKKGSQPIQAPIAFKR